MSFAFYKVATYSPAVPPFAPLLLLFKYIHSRMDECKNGNKYSATDGAEINHKPRFCKRHL